MQGIEEIKEIIHSIRTILEQINGMPPGMETIREIQMASIEVNHMLYHAEKLKFQKDYDLETPEAYKSFLEEAKMLSDLWEQSLQRRVGKSVDIAFWEIYEYFKYVEIDTIYQTVVRYFLSLPEGLRIEFLSLPYRYTFLQNKMDYTKGDYTLIYQHVEMMAKNADTYKWLYWKLSDYRSKMVLNGIIQYWFQFDLNKLYCLCETAFSDYCDLDILSCDRNDVIVDLGAYTGDSVQDFIHTYGEYKKIYAYEITPSTYQTLIENLSRYPNVIPMRKGAGKRAGVMFVNDGSHAAGNKLQDSGEIEVEVVTLDEDIKEPVSVIKMDIEGSEKDALLGAASHIQREKPKLLISSYHLPEDIFEIPHYINSIRDDYKFYLRFYGHGCLWPCDYVLFAV